MNLRAALEEIVQRPIDSLRDAELAREAADAIGQYLQWEASARRLLQQAHGEPAPPPPESLQGLTLRQAAIRVLQDAGGPLHIKELGARIKAGGWRHPRAENPRPDLILFQLASQLRRHSETFRWVGPNTFALTEWHGRSPGGNDRLPRIGLFEGPGAAVGAASAQSDEAVTAGDAGWRSS
jgi:HB1, ASXL, restriction endonuclease HTH domain